MCTEICNKINFLKVNTDWTCDSFVLSLQTKGALQLCGQALDPLVNSPLGLQPNLQCLTCNFVFPSREAILQHQLATRHMNLQCAACGKEFSEYAVLKRHISTVHQNVTFSCRYCSAKYNRRDNFRQHQLKTHGLLTCEICDRIYNDFRELSRHISDVHKHT